MIRHFSWFHPIFNFSKLSHFPQRINVLPPFHPQVWTNLDLPYILKSSFDCTFFFFDSHINLNHLLIFNFCQISIRLKKVCLWLFSAIVCLWAFRNGLFKKASKNFQMFWSGFFFHKNWNFDFLILGQIKWNLCRSYK